MYPCDNVTRKEDWKPDYEAYNAACDKDKPIKQVLDVFIHLTQGEPFNHDVQIWCDRPESFKEKTLKWLVDLSGYTEDYGYWDRRLKMRPIGDNSPQEELFEKWVDEYLNQMYPELKPTECTNDGLVYSSNPPIEMIFSSHKPTIDMFRRRGVFVFDCNQGD